MSGPWRARAHAQLLSGTPARTVLEVVRRLLAVQAQDARGARLSVRSRSAGLVSSDVDRALGDREAVVDWLQRGTLHLVAADDHPWLHALTAPTQLTTNARRLQQEGVPPADAERGVDALVRAVTRDGPLDRDVLREHVTAAGVRTQGQAFVHVLVLASLRGHLVRGPVVGDRQAYVLARDWLGAPPPVDRGQALALLAGRYLAGHGPASEADLARWSGLPLRDARAGLAALPHLDAREDGLLALPGAPEPPPLPPPRLLGTFEPLLLGWTSRDDVIGPHVGLVTSNGIFKAFALAGGRAVATWGRAGGRVVVDPLEPLPDDVTAALAQDAVEVARFLDG